MSRKWMLVAALCVLIGSLPSMAMDAYCTGVEDDAFASTFCNTTGCMAEGFGRSIALKGDYAVVGAPYNNNQGCVYVYHRDGGTWSRQATLTADDSHDYMMFGRSVDINAAGNFLVVGASCSSAGGSGPENDGGFYTFQRVGTSWSQVGSRVEAPDVEDTYRNSFGYSIALDDAGNTVVVGSPGSNPVNTNGQGTGAAYVFEFEGGWTPGWNYEYTIAKQLYPINGKLLGYRVDISGDGNTVVAIPWYEMYPWVATKSGGTWSQDILTYTGCGEGQPKSIAIRNNKIVAGVRGYPQTTGTHRIVVWELGTNGWEETESIVNTERLGLDDVDFNEDGTVFAITTWSTVADTEKIYVFHDVDGDWELGAEVTWSEEEQTDNQFRPFFIALDQGTLMVPVFESEDPVENPGKVLIYDMMDVYDAADVLYYCPPVLEYAVSKKRHVYNPEISEWFEITEGNVEPRPDGPTRIHFGFNHAIKDASGNTFGTDDITVSSGTKGLMAVSWPNAIGFDLPMTGVTDDETFTMTFTARTGSVGRTADFELSWDSLYGDADCDGDVDIDDYEYCVDAMPGEKSGDFEFRCDMNLDFEIDPDDWDIICDIAGLDPCPYTQQLRRQ